MFVVDGSRCILGLPPSILPPSLSCCPSPSVQLRVSEMELNKAQNLIEHKQEIFSRPARTWIAKQDLTAARSGVYSTVFSGAMQTCRLQQLDVHPWFLHPSRCHHTRDSS